MPGQPALSFRYLEPTFFAGLLDDPVLWLKVRPLGRALLFDCGQIHHLAKRLLKAVDALFISHAHMDHFMGLDTFTRNIHVSPKTIQIFGPPGLAERLGHKLAGYNWNLTENYWCTYLVNEVHSEYIKAFRLPGSEGFPCQFLEQTERIAAPIYSNRYLQVEAELADHKIPVLMFRIRERPAFLLDQEKLEHAGLVRGPWLKELKKLFFAGELRQNPLEVLRATGQSSEPFRVENAETLYHRIRKDQTPASIGYLTDVGFTPENRRRIKDFMQGVDWLICECTFLQEHQAKARKSYHLCTGDLNQLLDDLRPRFVLPMHLSKTYLGTSERLYQELVLPPGTTLLRLPEHLTPRPLLPEELPPLEPHR